MPAYPGSLVVLEKWQLNRCNCSCCSIAKYIRKLVRYELLEAPSLILISSIRYSKLWLTLVIIRLRTPDLESYKCMMSSSCSRYILFSWIFVTSLFNCSLLGWLCGCIWTDESYSCWVDSCLANTVAWCIWGIVQSIRIYFPSNGTILQCIKC